MCVRYNDCCNWRAECCSHEGGFPGAGGAGAAARVHRAVAAGPVVQAVAHSIIAARAVAGAVVQTAALLDSRQVVRQLVHAHGVVHCCPPHALHRSVNPSITSPPATYSCADI